MENLLEGFLMETFDSEVSKSSNFQKVQCHDSWQVKPELRWSLLKTVENTI